MQDVAKTTKEKVNDEPLDVLGLINVMRPRFQYLTVVMSRDSQSEVLAMARISYLEKKIQH